MKKDQIGILILVAFLGDILAVASGLLIGHWVRFQSGIVPFRLWLGVWPHRYWSGSWRFNYWMASASGYSKGHDWSTSLSKHRDSRSDVALQRVGLDHEFLVFLAAFIAGTFIDNFDQSCGRGLFICSG